MTEYKYSKSERQALFIGVIVQLGVLICGGLFLAAIILGRTDRSTKFLQAGGITIPILIITLITWIKVIEELDT